MSTHADYNPLSVLAIDMFTMTEERLQDQLTKVLFPSFYCTHISYPVLALIPNISHCNNDTIVTTV